LTEPILRRTARVLPVNGRGEVLLLQDQDPAVPGVLRWGTAGGGVDEGESLLEAAVRELREETGIVANAEQLGAPIHTNQVVFSWSGVKYLGHSTFFALAVDGGVAVSFDGLEPLEVGNVLAARWWTPEALAASGEEAWPGLCDIMRLAIDTVRQGVQ